MKNQKFNLKIATIATLFVFVAFFSCQSNEITDDEVKEEIVESPEPEEEIVVVVEEEEMTEEEMIVEKSDEDVGPYTTCNDEGKNETRSSADIQNAVNVGSIDDRSCYANYKESNLYGKTWGVYNITVDSNNQDAANTLQPRIERSLSRANTTGVGTYVKFTGTVRILEVGNTTNYGSTGSYIMQAKGKHSGGGGSPDPAICLYLAKPVYGTDSLGNRVQVSFRLYREQINVRGGAGGGGRQVVYLTDIKKDEPTDIVLEVGFRADPNDPTKRIQYSDAVIGGKVFNWDIPEPERGIQSGIRYGVYRVKGGRAQIRWADTTFKKVEKN